MIVVDTSFWVALRNRPDSHHELAARLMREHQDATLIVSNHVRSSVLGGVCQDGGS